MDPVELDLLYKRLLDRESTASAELFTRYFDMIVKYFIYSFGYLVDRDLIVDQVCNAFIDIIERPEKYQADKSHLVTYLQMDIRSNIYTILNKKTPRNVELSDTIQNTLYEQSLENQLISIDLVDKIRSRLKQIFLDKRDLEVAWNIICKVRKTIVYAEIIGLETLTKDQQKHEVKRYKDRVIKKLQRSGWDSFMNTLK